MRFLYTMLLISALTGPCGAGANHDPVIPRYLRCEYRVDPIGIDTAAPRLSWELHGDGRCRSQRAYRVLVATSKEALVPGRADLWDSGTVRSDRSMHIAYEGTPLASGVRVFWKVRVWDEQDRPSPWSDPAMWQMGLLRTEDWRAQWIGAPGPKAPATRAHNGYHSTLAGSPDKAKWVVVDLARRVRIDGLTLFPARPAASRRDAPGFLFPLRFRLDLSENPAFSTLRTVVDHTREDVLDPADEPTVYRFAPTACRYARLLVTRLRGGGANRFGFSLAELELLAAGENAAFGAHVTASDSVERGAWSKKYLTDGLTVSTAKTIKEPKPCPLLRTSFTLRAPVRRATAYVTALGLYELHLNDARVGDHVLAPELTDYHKRVQYQAYDVTASLRHGENVLGAILGDGWYAGRIGLSQVVPGGPLRGLYGLKPRLLLQLQIETADGERQTIVSDRGWRACLDGPVRRSCILDGEVYDARKNPAGWDLPGFDASAWKPVEAVSRVATRLVAQPNEPIRVVKELTPIAVTEPRPGMFIADMGQNMVGWIRLQVTGAAGSAVRLRHGEVLNPDGTLYRTNLRMPADGGPLGARQEDTFILAGEGKEVFEPRFTYHGFRYVELTGLSQKPSPDTIRGRVVASAAPTTGTFACSNPLLAKLMHAIVWTQRGNMHGMPTDCPQRDERLGWMGDAQAFSQTACFTMDMAAFFTKWIRDIRDDQAPDGRFPDFAPHPFDPATRFSGAPCWADAGVIVPWRMFVNYGDECILAEHFEAVTGWIEYVRSESPGLLWTGERGNNYGDWLNTDRLRVEGWPRSGSAVPTEILSTAFFAHVTEIAARMAHRLGRTEEARRYRLLAHDIRSAFRNAFVRADGRLRGNTQAGYVLAVHFNLLPEGSRGRRAAVAHLLEGIQARDSHLTTGIQTTGRAMCVLSHSGNDAVAYRLITDRRLPSWGYMIDHGATTVWERWDGFVEGRGFQDPGMNSFNHYAFGSVGEWMYRRILGINPDERHPGYKRFVLCPWPGGGLTWARGSYRSIHGTIASRWRLEGGTLELDVTIPPNTGAVVHVPTADPKAVTESGGPLEKAEGITVLEQTSRAVVLDVASGRYRFSTPWSERE